MDRIESHLKRKSSSNSSQVGNVDQLCKNILSSNDDDYSPHYYILNSFTLHIIQWGSGLRLFRILCIRKCNHLALAMIVSHVVVQIKRHTHTLLLLSIIITYLSLARHPTSRIIRNHKHMKWLVEHQNVCCSVNAWYFHRFIAISSAEELHSFYFIVTRFPIDCIHCERSTCSLQIKWHGNVMF